MILTAVPEIPAITSNQPQERMDLNASQGPHKLPFVDLVGQLNESVATSDKAIQGYILGENISTHELMISLQNAKQSLQIAVEVRNKIVEAYDKVTRMSI